MAGVFDYQRYINIFATAEDVLQIFPRDQRSLSFSFDNLGQDGWICDIDWTTLIVDQIKWKQDNEPDFTNSSVIGYFEGSTSTVVQSGTKIVFPNNMYTGPILPAANKNIPITALNINWYKGNLNFQRQFLLIQNWEPGTTIGDPENDPAFIPIKESYPIFVNWALSTSTGQVGTVVTVTAIATATSSTAIMNTVSTKLVQPFFAQITTSTLTTTNFSYGEMIGTFTVYANWIDNVLTPSSTFTITSSTLTTSSYTIVANITRNHPIRLEWLYDKERGYRGGYTSATTFVATDTRTFVYIGQPLALSLVQNSITMREGYNSVFTISHDKTGEGAITGVISLSGTFESANGGPIQNITLSTGTFNNNGVFTVTQILNTGTYTLQASYAGNLGVDIFKTQYLNTVSNQITHYVQAEAKTFTLTEMLIQEGPNYDILYAHAIDDGRTSGEIGGIVTFYHNSTVLGTSTFVRHTYNWPQTEGPINTFRLMPTSTYYPYPEDPKKYYWDNRFPINRPPRPWYYTQSNPEYPSYLATLKLDSKDLDWPPTNSAINTIGLINVSNADQVARTPFAIKIPNPQYTAGSSSSNQPPYFLITCVEYLGMKDYPSYPAQTHSIKSQYSTEGKTKYTFPAPEDNITWNISTAPQGPFPQRESGNFRTAGTRYFWRQRPGAAQGIYDDLADVWAQSLTGNQRPAVTKVQIYRFTETLPQASSVDPLLFSSEGNVYGQKKWTTYTANENHRCSTIYDALIGATNPGDIELYTVQTQTGNTVYSRSHLATLQKPLGTLPTTGTFTATFGGTLYTGPGGYYAADIAFQDTAATEIKLYNTKNITNLTRTNNNDWPVYTNYDYAKLNYAFQQGFLPGGLPAIYNRQSYFGWINTQANDRDGWAPNNGIITRNFIGQIPSIQVISTAVAYANILQPLDGRYYPLELSTTYYKRLGWLSRRIPKGQARIKIYDYQNSSTTATILSDTLEKIDPSTSYVSKTIIEPTGFQFLQLPAESNIPAPLRYDNHPWRSGTGGNKIYNLNRLSILNTGSLINNNTSTEIIHLAIEYVPNINGCLNTTSMRSSQMTIERGVSLQFISASSYYANAFAGAPFFTDRNDPPQAYQGLEEHQVPTEQTYLIYSGVHTIPWQNVSGSWQRRLFLGSDVGTSTQYTVYVPHKISGSSLVWYVQWKIERYTADGTTLLGSQYKQSARYGSTTVNNLNPFFKYWVALAPGTINYTQDGSSINGDRKYEIYNSFYEDGINRTGAEPANQSYLWKIYVSIVPSLAGAWYDTTGNTNFIRNTSYGIDYGKVLGPLTDTLVLKTAEWGYDPNYISITTMNNTGTEITIFNKNGI